MLNDRQNEVVKAAGVDGISKRVLCHQVEKTSAGFFDRHAQDEYHERHESFCRPGYRLYLATRDGELIILLCSGNKSSQTRDITRTQRTLSALEPQPMSKLTEYNPFDHLLAEDELSQYLADAYEERPYCFCRCLRSFKHKGVAQMALNSNSFD